MTASIVILLFTALFTKHLIFDFICQGPYQYLNKGTYGHPGGLLHAGLQAAGTVVSLMFFPQLSFTTVVVVAVAEFVIHYHIDWAKMNLNKVWNLQPTNSEQFWWLLGFDQYLHYMTYTGMVAYIVTNQ